MDLINSLLINAQANMTGTNVAETGVIWLALCAAALVFCAINLGGIRAR
jgi:hypothetical protein